MDIATGIELNSAGVPNVQCNVLPIQYKTGVVLVHSENDGAYQQYTVVPIWICTDILKHTVLYSNACTDLQHIQHVNIDTVETMLESLESLCICLHTVMMDRTHQ